MKMKSLALATLVALGLGLTACGGSYESRYESIKDDELSLREDMMDLRMKMDQNGYEMALLQAEVGAAVANKDLDEDDMKDLGEKIADIDKEYQRKLEDARSEREGDAKDAQREFEDQLQEIQKSVKED